MSGTFSVIVQEARGFVAVPTDLDRLAVVVGCASGSSGLSSFFLSAQAAIADRGYGDAVDTLCQIIEQRQSNGTSAKIPAAMFSIAVDVSGTYGAIDLADVTGTARPAVDNGGPLGTYDAGIRIIDGGVVGTSGITYQRKLDYGDTWSRTFALGTDTTIAIPNSSVGFTLEAAAAQVAAFVAAVVEARADTLAHLANVTAHDAADTSAAQITLAASSVPTTEAEAVTVLNLCRLAFAAHEPNITAHNGPDPVNVVSHAAATNGPTGIDLYIEYKSDFNAHLGIALAAAPAGLKAATATLATTTQTFTSADLLDAGEALLAVYPRRPTFTTAGGTASDAPSTVTIVGTDYADAAQTETGLALAQTAATVRATKAFKTITSIAYAADGGTGATIAIGYELAVHNSADITNTLSSTSPAQGTLLAGDEWSVRTLGPTPAMVDLYDGSVTPPTGALADLATAPIDFSLLVLDFPITGADLATITTGLNKLTSVGKRVTVLTRCRIPNFETAETEAAWLAAVAADFALAEDSRVLTRGAYGLLTDAATGRVYLRSTLAQIAADTARVDIDVWPSAPADQAEANVRLVDVNNDTVGHDEGDRGAVTGLSDDTQGNRFSCEQRLDDFQQREAVFNTVPWVLYAADERIRHLMARRVANAMERAAVSAAIRGLGGKLFYNLADPNTPGSTPTLTETSRNAVHAAIYGKLATRFAKTIQNAGDANVDSGLVQVAPAVAVASGGLLGLTVTLAPFMFGYLQKLTLTLAVKDGSGQ